VSGVVDRIERLLTREDWGAARRVIRAALRLEPGNHWFLTRMGTTYYEQRRYRDALTCNKKALRLAPRCPLALWDYAGTLDMLGRKDEAVGVYRRLLRRGVESLASGECGEGVRWARGLTADVHYRLAGIHASAGRRRAALRAIEAHRALRGSGRWSIYSTSDVKTLERRLD
jgi:tetratricopeptide (TPR) repeat protein